MKLLAYEVDKRSFLGVLNEDETWVYPVSAAGMEYRSMKDLIREAGPSEMEMLDYISKKAPGDVMGAAPVDEIRVVSPIAEPDQDIICLGLSLKYNPAFPSQTVPLHGSGYYLPGNQLYGSRGGICEI